MPLDMDQVNREETSPGLGGMMRMIGILAVIVFALVGGLAVTGQIPQEQVADWFMKAGMLLGIVIAVAVAIRLLSMKKG